MAVLLTAVGVLAAWWHHAQGYPLYYGDAEAHLNIARRVVDSRTPGYDQIGTVWLPLPHVLTMPFVRSLDLWRSGMAGTIPGVACFVLAGTLLFALARFAFASAAAAFAAALLFALNPNVLYLATTPMTEPVYFAALAGVVYFTVRGNAIAAGLFSCAASLTRYEGWALIPAAGVVFLIAHGFRRAFAFGLVASVAPLYWLGHNWVYFGNPLEFYNGPHSNIMINRGPYPGEHDWPKAWLYYRSAVQLCAGWGLVIAGAVGMPAALFRRAWWAVALLAVSPAFVMLSMHSSNSPIFLPHLWPNSYYNTRYGLAALPLLAFTGAALVALLPDRFRAMGAAAVVVAATLPWLAHSRPDAWITWKESQVNSEARRAWTKEAADFFKANYRSGDGIVFGFGDLTGVVRVAGIPMRELLHDGNNPQFDAVLARPDLFLHEQWALTISADRVATALLKLSRSGVHYQLVKSIPAKNNPPVEIYRRVRPLPTLP
ncbi:MAG TPA: hypothetical protein VER03_26675 [Bryobacteraceae bacterium]|nr:hypothetical protein [Bryobacteraceae bacterium]